MWEERNIYSLLVGVKTGIVTMEINVGIPQIVVILTNIRIFLPLSKMGSTEGEGLRRWENWNLNLGMLILRTSLEM